jgi:hypothetical protein
MLSVTNKPLMLSVIMLNVAVLSVDMLSVVAQICYHLNFVSYEAKKVLLHRWQKERITMKCLGAKQVLKCIKKKILSKNLSEFFSWKNRTLKLHRRLQKKLLTYGATIFLEAQSPIQLKSKGLFTRKSDFALGLQVYNTNSIFLYTKMN